MEIEIKHHEKDGEGRFFILNEAGEETGMIDYTLPKPKKLVIQHTELKPELRGTGASGKLIDAVAEYARNSDLKIVPVCPFAKKYMTKNREKYQDVLV